MAGAAVTAALVTCAPSPGRDALTLVGHSTGPSPGGAATPTPSASSLARGGTVVVRFLDVGQGDAAVVTTDDRHAIVIDAGPPTGYRRVLQAVRSLGDATLDAMVLTHPHSDHLGLLPDLLARESFERLIEPGLPDAHPEYTGALAVAGERRIPVGVARRGLRLELGGRAEVTVLAPTEPLLTHTRDDLNANSVVLRIDHRALGGDVRFLFEGDAEEATERRLLEDRASLRADVLKVAHHGSEHATSDAFLDAVAPRLAVISCGGDNEYGHPNAQTLRRLEEHHVVIARTDLEGDVTVTSDDHGLRWTTDRAADPAELKKPGHGAHPENAP